MSKRGRVAMPLALAWRQARGSGETPKLAFKELCAYLDHCNAEDKAAGRPSMAELLGFRKRHGELSAWREVGPNDKRKKAA